MTNKREGFTLPNASYSILLTTLNLDSATRTTFNNEPWVVERSTNPRKLNRTLPCLFRPAVHGPRAVIHANSLTVLQEPFLQLFQVLVSNRVGARKHRLTPIRDVLHCFLLGLANSPAFTHVSG